MRGDQGLQCVKGEIHNVLAILRLAVRTASDSFYFLLPQGSSSAIQHLVQGFQGLYDQLGFYSTLDDINCTVYLAPFVAAIESPQASAEVTRTALLSVHKFLLYGLITSTTLGAKDGLQQLVLGTIGCKFQESSSDAAEALYLKLMETLLECVRCQAGERLPNDAICAAFESCFHIRTSPSSSLLLSQYAENILAQFTLIAFSKIRQVEEGMDTLPPESGDHSFGVPAMYRVLRFLTAIIDPEDDLNDKASREFGLRLVNIALETTGPLIAKHRILLDVVQDDLCRRLLQNSQTVHPDILSLTLRIVFNLFNHVKRHLKIQLEVFFTSIHLRIGESESTSFDLKEIILESLVEFCREPSLIVGIYRNYDCEVGSTNLFEDLCSFLARQALPNDKELDIGRAELNSIHSLALEAFLAILDSIAKQFCSARPLGEFAPDDDSENQFELQIANKKEIESQARRWNLEGPNALSTILKTDTLDPFSVARFLYVTPGLDRYLIGAYLGMPTAFHKQVLEEYLGLFEFADLRIEEALRAFLESFVLPGEAQIIGRIMECFSKRYFASNQDGVIASHDAAFILAYSIIMLNTDAHNPSVKTRMSLKDWLCNNRGLNDGQDFPSDFLESVFHSIRQQPMIIESKEVKGLLEEAKDGTNQSTVSASGWEKLLSRANDAGTFKTAAAQALGKEMFSLLWNPAVLILSFYIEQSENPKVLQRVIEGFHSFSRIAAAFEATKAFNHLVTALCHACIEQMMEIASSAVLPAAASLGRHPRAQRIITLLFSLILGQQLELEDAWAHVVQCILWLNKFDLLPDSFAYMDDLRNPISGQACSSIRSSDVPIETRDTVIRVQQSTAYTLLSSVFEYLSHPDEHVEDVFDDDTEDANLTEEDTAQADEYAMIGSECIASCHIEQVFQQSQLLSDVSLLRLIEAFILISVKGSMPNNDRGELQYRVCNNEAAVFCVERLSDIVELTQTRIHVYWDTLARHFRHVLTHAQETPSLYLERIVVNLFRLGVYMVSMEHSLLPACADLLLLLHGMPSSVFNAFALRFSSGFYAMAKANGAALTALQQWSELRSFLETLKANPESEELAALTLQCLETHTVTIENFTAYAADIAKQVPTGSTLRSCKPTLDLLLDLHFRIKSFVSKEKTANKNLKPLWLSSLSNLAQFSDPKYEAELRIYAMDCLQRAILSPQLSIKSPHIIEALFDTILFPMLDDVMAEQKQSIVCEQDFRIKLANIHFQTVLFYMGTAVRMSQFNLFWVKFMGRLEKFMVRDIPQEQEEQQAVQFSESLRNAYQLMSSLDVSQDVLALTLSVIQSSAHGSNNGDLAHVKETDA